MPPPFIKIGILTSVHSPLDGRIFYKEAKSLARAGYEVVVIAQNDGDDVVDGIKIIGLQKCKNRFERITKVVWRLFRVAFKEKADIYHFHDPELIPIGLLLRLFGKKVIYDMHELVFFSIEDKVWLKNSFLRKLSQLFYISMERISVMMFDQLILAEDGYENYVKRNYKNFYKYTIIRNFPILCLIDNTSVDTHVNKKKPVIIYIGGLTKIRGIKEIIQSMEYVTDKGELWLLGKWETEAFKKECEALKGWKYTKYFGSVPLTEVYKYIKMADIGVSILHPIKNYVTSLPVKTFEYMTCSLPIIMSNFPYWQQTFKDCALFVNPYDTKDIAEKISFLLDNPHKVKELGRKGRQLIEEKYSWEAESNKLIELYEKLLIKDRKAN